MKNIYLCGPVTGRKPQETVKHFGGIEEMIRERTSREAFNGQAGIVNPVTLCEPDMNWHKAMRACVSSLVKCDGIALLQGWQRSKGAALELKLAQDLHIPVVFVEQPVDYLGLNELFTAAPETLRCYNKHLTKFHNEGLEESLAENRAILELTNRYLNPYGFEYIEIEGASI
ncbi:MAG: DUF4406 domain-containing protein [Treponema sp.]|nr:DUF4406 domain-containing protein [Treponema sp.]